MAWRVCIYNMTVPNVDNWRRFVNEPQCGDPFLCELYSDPHVGPKVVLNIMDGLIAQFGGGPDWQPDYSWIHATLYVGKDPVAIDSTALRLIEERRKEESGRPRWNGPDICEQRRRWDSGFMKKGRLTW